MVHELAHAKGKSEAEARTEQAKYLAKNGYQIRKSAKGFEIIASDNPVLPHSSFFDEYIESFVAKLSLQ